LSGTALARSSPGPPDFPTQGKPKGEVIQCTYFSEGAKNSFTNSPLQLLLGLYLPIVILGSLLNLSMLVVIVGTPKLRQDPRNAFILTLAVSDFFLCNFTSPLTLWSTLEGHWPFGYSSRILCQVCISLILRFGRISFEYILNNTIMDIGMYICIFTQSKVQTKIMVGKFLVLNVNKKSHEKP
jgi:hypothetical protein